MKNIFKLAFCILLIVFGGMASAGNWQNSWEEEKADAVQRCTDLFENYQLQALCMDNEKDGFKRLQSDYGLPNAVAAKAKQDCARMFDDFQMQDLCMENEKSGYDKMQAYQ